MRIHDIKMIYLKVLRDVKNETNLVVLQKEDITGYSSFGTSVISAQQKSFGTGSYCMAVPNTKLGVSFNSYFSKECFGYFKAKINSLLLFEEQKYSIHVDSAHLFRKHPVSDLHLAH